MAPGHASHSEVLEHQRAYRSAEFGAREVHAVPFPHSIPPR
ncbi:hypothetical protein [Streptomyces sp. NPDC051642]